MTKTSGVATIARKMLVDLNRRYTFATNPEVHDFDAVYVSSTLVNPAYRKILNNQQVEKAREFLLQLMLMRKDAEIDRTSSENEHANFNTIELTDNEIQDSQPPTKRFKHLERVGKLLDKEDNQQENEEDRATQISKEEQQLNQYIECKVSKEEKKLDPFEYWLMKKNEYPDLSQIACEILAFPASTAPVERIFSSGGEATKGKRNRLTNNNLEREIFLRRNKRYI